MTTPLQALRFAIGQLRKSPGFAIAAVLTLAMAILANAVVLSVMNGLILRPLNVPQAHSLYGIERASDKDMSQSYPDYLDLRDRNHSFDDLAAFSITQVALDTGENPSPIWGVEASGNHFDALRIQQYLGRFFHACDEHGANSAPYIVLSDAHWHSHFHDDRGMLGRVIQLNKHPLTILGIAPPKFRGTVVFVSPNFFVPVVNHEQVDGANDLNDRPSRWLLTVVGRLKAGVTLAQETANLNSIGTEKTYPKDERQAGFLLGRPGLFRFIVYHLFDIKHYSLFTRAQEKRLHRVDERLFQAECLGKALKGNGWRGAVRHNSAVPNTPRELRAL